jgi:hypothetical protein
MEAVLFRKREQNFDQVVVSALSGKRSCQSIFSDWSFQNVALGAQ